MAEISDAQLLCPDAALRCWRRIAQRDDFTGVKLTTRMSEEQGEVLQTAAVLDSICRPSEGNRPHVSFAAQGKGCWLLVAGRWHRLGGFVAGSLWRGNQRQLLVEHPQGQVGGPLEREAPPRDALFVELHGFLRGARCRAGTTRRPRGAWRPLEREHPPRHVSPAGEQQVDRLNGLHQCRHFTCPP